MEHNWIQVISTWGEGGSLEKLLVWDFTQGNLHIWNIFSIFSALKEFLTWVHKTLNDCKNKKKRFFFQLYPWFTVFLGKIYIYIYSSNWTHHVEQLHTKSRLQCSIIKYFKIWVIYELESSFTIQHWCFTTANLEEQDTRVRQHQSIVMDFKT